MSYIIAIILGMFIVFNWTPIKYYMDHKIETTMNQDAPSSEEKPEASETKKSENVKQEAASQKKSKEDDKDDKGSDIFSKFR